MAEPSAVKPVDPDDPRAPSEEVWAQLSAAERARVVAELPASAPFELYPPEGDAHRSARDGIRSVLDSFYRRIGRRVYVASEMVVYYPGQPRFVPDVLAVTDVDPHERTTWVVSAEGKGLDVVVEVLFLGEPHKDLVSNVERYAALGIPEYFVFDRRALSLRGWRLQGARPGRYEPLLPQAGRLRSEVLGLELTVEGTRLRFYHGTAALLDAEEVADKLGRLVDELVAKREVAEKERVTAEQERDQERQAKELLERELAEARAELRRLKEHPGPEGE
jgi:Uma2 family endonuclease